MIAFLMFLCDKKAPWNWIYFQEQSCMGESESLSSGCFKVLSYAHTHIVPLYYQRCCSIQLGRRYHYCIILISPSVSTQSAQAKRICPSQADVLKSNGSSHRERLSLSCSGTKCFLNWNHFDALLGTHSLHPGWRPTAAHINWSISLILWSYMTQAPLMPLKGAAPAIFSMAAAPAGSTSSLLEV